MKSFAGKVLQKRKLFQGDLNDKGRSFVFEKLKVLGILWDSTVKMLSYKRKNKKVRKVTGEGQEGKQNDDSLWI